MPLSTIDQHLLRISKARRADISLLKEGAHLERALGRPIDDLQAQACGDRMRLAEAFCQSADRLMRARPPMFRVATGRYYYAMYHAMRAVVYFQSSGDDHEQHSQLAGKTPADFPNGAYWQNELKDARLRRNEADYNPYPATDRDFINTARHMRREAHSLLSDANTYLHANGCGYL